ncbi:probable APS1 - AP-1 complex subunit, sigma1 subunit, 18 KD [Pseudozyma flocculosa]|uniref:AP complex subunit sigma n=1 Tax=Pseudozyma flocculosa TaxID=84751 RepID=A0A5C3EX88_9BASI|nr:probable APS1 - AP-1 complex subunit, sigma1 subunit, 18 KD [Pseudozyma flocculosa]
MAINWILLISRQGKVRLAKWFTTMSPKAKTKIIKDVTQLVLARRTRMCNFLEYKGALARSSHYRFSATVLLIRFSRSSPFPPSPTDSKVVYRRYASLFFVTGISQGDNELVTLEIIHRYVEILDRYFGNVCELDLIFNFQKAYAILDELIIAGEMQESSKKSVLRTVSQSDSIEEAEQSEDSLARIGSRSG